MGLDNVKIGAGWVSEYQMSSIPYVTSSVITPGHVTNVHFNFVTRFFKVTNTSTGSTQLNVGFTLSGVMGSNYYPLQSGETVDAEFRLFDLYLSGAVGGALTYTVLAGMTGISTENMLPLSGSLGLLGLG